MSKMTPVLAWYPPQFPKQGRLPTSAALFRKNCRMQDSRERAYRNELCLAAGKRIEPPCCKTLHISIFFDGTGNNLNNDLYLSTPPHPTNIARLFRATIGQGTAGGVQGRQEELFDLTGEAGNQYFKYYIPGVGTPFPEVSDLDYSMPGLAAATYGEERINWGLIRIIDALRLTLDMPGLTDDKSWDAVRRMTAPMGAAKAFAASLRSAGFQRLLTELEPNLKRAVVQPEPGKTKLLGIKLYVYGFSRGAASARAFVNWLAELLPNGLTSPADNWRLPLSVEFLGLLDTVASVGVARIAPLAEGHMEWADGTMELPDTGLIKSCVHLVSAHEQRLCFPLDSICYHDGSYPSWAKEVVYPGMHSDIGGGYPPGDQGKAVADNDANLLSQVVLHDMYASAFQVGAPMKVPKQVLPDDLKKDIWRTMPFELSTEFYISEALVNRFNAWRDLTLHGYSWRADISDEDAAQYKPERASANIIEILEEQMAWITAWRIGRYAHGTYREQDFYKDSAANGLNKDSDPAVRKVSEKARDKKQKKVEDTRREMLISAKKGVYIPYPPGIKDFDPSLGQTQLRDAAEEFREDYQRKRRTQTGNFLFQSSEALSNLVYTFSDDDLTAEYKRMKKAGNARFEKLFPARRDNSHEQLWVLVRELFDNQVHDSRAWFLQATLDAREPWGSYFLYRMIYFGEVMSKNVTPLIKYGRFIKGRVLDSLPGAAVYIERFEKIIGVEDEEFPPEIKQKILIESHATDIPVTQYSDFIAQPALTREPVEAIALQKTQLEERELADKKAIIASLWS